MTTRNCTIAAVGLVAFEGAAPRLFRPMYAEANMGHPSRDEGFVLCSHLCDADELHQRSYPTWFRNVRLQP